jgi:hypothetical protein
VIVALLAYERMKYKHQPTQPGNPRQLTINQHVMPRSSIARFTDGDVVEVVSLQYDAVKARHPGHEVFCVKRLWDQKAETIGSRQIEGAYQQIADAAVNGCRTFTKEQHEAITEMFFLWKARFETKGEDREDIYANGITGSALDLDQQEILESKGVMFMLEGGRMPRRFMNGIGLRMRIDYDRIHSGSINWGILEAIEGEFIVPDTTGSVRLMPISPKLCFMGGQTNIRLNFEAVAETNAFLRTLAVDYYFARDLKVCPVRKLTRPFEYLLTNP